jgi:hypothetical protein
MTVMAGSGVYGVGLGLFLGIVLIDLFDKLLITSLDSILLEFQGTGSHKLIPN